MLLDSQGHIKLTDFGLSKIKQSKDALTNSFCGTPEYIAPEIILGQEYGNEVDFWSFGLLIYEMLSGINPFKLKNLTRMERLTMIVEYEIQMFRIFSNEAKDFLKKLLTREPT